MVGIPRSKGCRICVQRRVRCDLTKPICNNCKKGNRPCPGYETDLKFQDEGAKIRKRYAKKDRKHEEHLEQPQFEEHVFDLGSTSASSRTSESPNSQSLTDLDISGPPTPVSHEALIPQRNSFYMFMESQRAPNAMLSESGNPAFGWPLMGQSAADDESMLLDDDFSYTSLSQGIVSPNMAQDQLLYLFHEAMKGDRQKMPVAVPLRAHGNWLTVLPTFTGRNTLLDTAVRAVGLAHLGILHGNDSLMNDSRPLYGKALRLLNNAITDQTEGLSSETLSATIMLSFYEMFTADANDCWVRHAGGAAALMKIRGPQRHRYGFDREIFMAYRHTIIIEAFHRDEPCFLREPEWLQLSRDIHEDFRRSDIDRQHLELFDLAEQFYETMLGIPTLLYEARYLKAQKEKQKEKSISTKTFKADLIKRAQETRTALKTFFTKFKDCLARVGQVWTSYVSGDHIVPIYYEFPNIFIGTTCHGYWSVLSMLNFLLMELEKVSSPERAEMYRVENKENAMDICRGTAYQLTSSFIGPFFVIFGLRVCLATFTDDAERDWVISKLFEIGSRHMSIAKHIPGFEPGSGIVHVRKALVNESRVEEI